MSRPLPHAVMARIARSRSPPLRVRPETYIVFSTSWKGALARKRAEGDAGAGAFFGSCIANPFEVSDEHLAGRRGVLVAICAYVIFALEVGTMSVSPLEAGLSAFMGAVLLSGWLALPAAFFAGVMGFRASQGGLQYSRASQV